MDRSSELGDVPSRLNNQPTNQPTNHPISHFHETLVSQSFDFHIELKFEMLNMKFDFTLSAVHVALSTVSDAVISDMISAVTMVFHIEPRLHP